MVKIQTYLLIPVLLLLACAASAKIETADMGPFIAEFDVGDAAGEHEIIINPPYQFDNYNEYYFRVDSTAEPYIDVYIDDYGSSVDVSEGKLMEVIENTFGKINRGATFDWRLLASVGGRPAVFANVTYNNGRHAGYDANGKHAGYDAAYSPDGIGNLGSIIVGIYSAYPESVTDKFLSKLKIKRT